MKQKLVAITLLFGMIALYRNNLPAPDPSGSITLEKLRQQHPAGLAQTGLIADPSGVAIVQAQHQNP